MEAGEQAAVAAAAIAPRIAGIGAVAALIALVACLDDPAGVPMSDSMNPGALRRLFAAHLLAGLRVVWPILAVLLGLMVALGCTVALLEHWSLFEGIYFAFVSGLTIGYGDLAPKATLARALAVTIGFIGVLLTGLVAAVGVQALQATQQGQR
jgi:hypothetical protein